MSETIFITRITDDSPKFGMINKIFHIISQFVIMKLMNFKLYILIVITMLIKLTPQILKN